MNSIFCLFQTWILQATQSVKIQLKLGFPTGWDSATFRDEGTAKIQEGTGRDSQNPERDAGQNGTEQERTF